MSLTSRVSGTDPAEVLASAALRLGLQVDPETVSLRFQRHASPQSLKALVEIAPELGLEARAFRSDIAGLGDATVPAVVHIVHPAEEDSGFALLLEIGPDRFVIDEGDGGEPRTLDEDGFKRCWSGIIVTLAPHAGAPTAAAPRHGGLRMRFRTWYRRDDPLARATLLGRRGAMGGVVLLALVSAVGFGHDVAGPLGAGLAGTMAILAGVATVASVTLFHRSRRGQVPMGVSRLSSSICGRGRFTDCLGVLSSRFSRFAGIDWGSIGVAFFVSVLAMSALGAVPGPGRGPLYAWLAIAYVLALPGSVALTAVQVYPLRRFCPLCMIVHGVVILSAALGVAYLANGGWPARAADLWPYAVVHAAVFLGSFGLVVPYLSLDLESQTNRARLGWIGATPWGALAEAAGRPAAVTSLPEAPIRVGEPSAPFRLDALVHPMCTGCGPVVQKLQALERRHAGRVSIGFHVAPRDVASLADGELCSALAGVGVAVGGPAAVEAFLEVKREPWTFLMDAEDGARSVAARLHPGLELPEATLERARRSVTAADRLAEALERGTPTLLVLGRFWDASIEDLDELLGEHPDLLASALGIRLEDTSPSRAEHA